MVFGRDWIELIMIYKIILEIGSVSKISGNWKINISNGNNRTTCMITVVLMWIIQVDIHV